MKILYVGRYTPKHPKAYGGDIHLYNIAKELTKLGHKTYFLNVHAAKTDERMQLKKVRYIKHRNTPFYPDKRDVLKAVQEFNPDVIHYESCWGYTVEKLRGEEVVKTPTVASMFSSRLASAKIDKPWKMLLSRHKPYRWLAIIRERYCAKHANMVTTTSRAMVNRISADFNIPASKIERIPRGVDTNLFKLALLPDENVILTVARLEIEKGIHHILKATAQTSEKIEDVKLLIAGEGRDKSYFMKLVEKLKLNDKVDFIGRIPHSKMSQLYARSKLVVLYSIWEPFGAVLLEAMACARPVIASKCGGPLDIVTPECGLLVPPEDPTQLSQVIISLLSDKEEAEEMGLNGRERVLNNFTWKIEAKKYEKVYLGLNAARE